MKRLVLLLVIFLIAVAVAPMLINEKGYILVAMGDLTIESTVVTATIGLVILILALLLSLRIIGGGFRFSKVAWHKVLFASKKRAIRDFNKGIAAFIIKDYQQAEHLLVKASEHSDISHACYILAASASSKLGLTVNSQHYLNELAHLDGNKQNANMDAIVVTVSLCYEQQEYASARAVLDEYHKHVGHDARLLALEISLSIAEKRFLHAVEMLVLARKQKTLSETQLAAWEKQAFYGAFNQQLVEHDSNRLFQFWNNLSRKLKHRDEIALAYLQVLAENNLTTRLDELVAPLLKKDSDEIVLKRLRLLPIKNTDKLLPLIQKQLQKQPNNAKWLSFLAHISSNSQQWEMAEKAFNSLFKLPESAYDDCDLSEFAQVLTQLDKHEQANQIWLKHYREQSA